MTFRKIVSLSIALSFVVLLITGLLSYFTEYTRTVATIHTVFGVLFSLAILFHLKNNLRSLKVYSKGKMIVLITLAVSLFLMGAYFQVQPFGAMMDYGARLKANSEQEVNLSEYEIIEMSASGEVQLTLDLLRGEHYWHPQMAVWLEDMQGNYMETLFVSKATARGLFFGGRSKENFKSFDEKKQSSGDYRRVNALPVWSHKKGKVYADGMYVPPSNDPLPDAIAGATIADNFKLISSTNHRSKFRLRIEINVAFDDNEFYSEFDFPNDEVFHNGTGQLGQPSIVFEAEVDLNDGKKYYLMELIGHGHQSGQNGKINSDLSTLTTAKEIVERIVVSAHAIEDGNM
ncbi:DUF4405 domain-containing protein [Aureisphaera galaxeae]|uniref:DUF4405 domain-containing protein n=1 Tax=Aureisphaera galaxeae TaxID=1538023 RepID=UPI0023506CAC|nr:DUF4405 domain-containing protein [Aureisphaera galaxeae]MDC8005842.1 DUF4405 domain-containing protein [Aureisphaera galaxeae]